MNKKITVSEDSEEYNLIQIPRCEGRVSVSVKGSKRKI